MFRIGFGNDIHRLVAGKRLILGGVEIESDLGAEGHSDADALTHAVTDAVLGALALGDIGMHFPNSEERWRDAESFVFLSYAVGLIKGKGYFVVNVDATIDLEKPKLRRYIQAMREGIAQTLEIGVNQVSVKAKSGEGIGIIGESNAVAATAVVLLAKGG